MMLYDLLLVGFINKHNPVGKVVRLGDVGWNEVSESVILATERHWIFNIYRFSFKSDAYIRPAKYGRCTVSPHAVAAT